MRVILTPSRDNVCIEFAYDLAALIRHSPDVIFSIAKGSILPNLRNQLVETALDNGATELLFIDSDMRFPPDTFERLSKSNLDIVGANCKQKVKDEWTARVGDKSFSSEHEKEFDKVGHELVTSLGFGVTLVKAKVFEKLPKPWFKFEWDGTKFAGEDVYFSLTARAHGFGINIDHDLSQQVKHIITKEV